MKKITSYCLLFGSLFTVLYVFNTEYILNKYELKKLKVIIEVLTSEDDIFQLFYREASGKLNEGLSEKIKVIGSEKPQILHYNIPDTLRVSHFRFDFGNSKHESDVKINKIIFSYNGNMEIIDSDTISELFKTNSYTEQDANSFSRKVINGRSDPFLLSGDLEKLINCLKERPNHSRIILNIFLSAILSISICLSIFFYGKNIKLGGKDDILFISVFMLVLLLPHIDELFNIDNTAISEKRELKKKPEITFDNYDEYPENFEIYYNDNFGFRKKMVSLGSILKIKVFNSIPNSNDVIVGKDNWLFYWNNAIKKSYLNKNPFNSLELANFGDNLKKIDLILRERNKTFIVTVYPNKHTIYEEKIPTRFKNLKREGKNRLEQVFSYLKTNNIQYIDHTEMLLSKKESDVLYLKNDSHWNTLGAFYAYQNIIDKISESRETVKKPLGIEDFKVETNENYVKGDLLDLMGIDNSGLWLKDTYLNFTPLKEIELEKIFNKFGSGSIIVENRHSDNDEVALFFGDSYSLELMKFLPLSFRKTILVRDIRLNDKIIKQVNPSIVVYGIVERNLENF